MIGSVTSNVSTWGVGCLNIDATRIKYLNQADIDESVNKNRHKDFNSNNGIRCPTKGIYGGDFRPPENHEIRGGRWPANVILNEELEPEFPVLHGAGIERHIVLKNGGGWKQTSKLKNNDRFGDSGSSARFFKQVKEDI